MDGYMDNCITVCIRQQDEERMKVSKLSYSSNTLQRVSGLGSNRLLVKRANSTSHFPFAPPSSLVSRTLDELQFTNLRSNLTWKKVCETEEAENSQYLYFSNKNLLTKLPCWSTTQSQAQSWLL